MQLKLQSLQRGKVLALEAFKVYDATRKAEKTKFQNITYNIAIVSCRLGIYLQLFFGTFYIKLPTLCFMH